MQPGPTKMPASRKDIRPIIAAIEPLRGAGIVRELGGGPASDSWLLEVSGRQFVLRIDQPAAHSLGLDRQAEIEVLMAVSAAGIGPEPVWADCAKGILVYTYIEGETWSRQDAGNPALLRELAVTLRTLHGLPALGRRFEPAVAARRYASDIGTAAARRMSERAGKLAASLLADSGRPALCHNDLVHSNIIHHGPVYLIDWEYAAVGDPFFDLAVVVQHHQLSSTVTEVFLQAYFGTVGTGQLEKLEAYCSLYDYLAGLWYLSMAGESAPASPIRLEMNRVMARLAESGLAE